MTSQARLDAARLAALLRAEHHAMADFLVALAAFDERRHWAELGHANLWAFLHRGLGLSAGAAHGRKVAARLVRGFPSVEAALRDGRLCLSSVVELAKVLTPENQAAVLPRYFRLSAREAKEVTAELAPRSAIPARTVVTVIASPMRLAQVFQTSESEGASTEHEVPPPAAPIEAIEGGTPVADLVPALTLGVSTHGSGVPTVEAPTLTGAATESRAQVATGAGPGVRAGSATAGSAGDEIVPLDADLRRLHLTVSRRFLEKLEAAKALRSHAQPAASAGAILETALDLLLSKEAKPKTATTSRAAATPRPCAPGRVPAAVRREVWARDEGRCQWPLAAGGICGSSFQLELDHVHPRARGGPSTVDNLRLLCGPHNAEAARRTYGEAFMARVVEQARRNRPSAGRRRGRGRE